MYNSMSKKLSQIIPTQKRYKQQNISCLSLYEFINLQILWRGHLFNALILGVPKSNVRANLDASLVHTSYVVFRYQIRITH